MTVPESASRGRLWMRASLLLALAALGAAAASGAATTYNVLVAPSDSAAYENAQSTADDKTVWAERKIHAAFAKAQELLAGCDKCTVQIKIAGGIYEGRASTGQWIFPDVQAPAGVVRILGGYAEDFSRREPFAHPTVLQVSRDRSAPVLQFEGKKHALGELVISGLTIDVSPSNGYHGSTNSLLKGSSSSFPVLALGYLTTDRLVISDNVFMNAPNGVGGPLIRAMTADAEVRVENNVFYNNVHTWTVGSGGGKHIPARYVISGNSFVLNWPYNPDRTTSNPGTVEIGNKYSAGLVEIRDNLFAYNPGGAIHPQWDDTEGPKIAFAHNLFFKNGSMFDAPPPAGGAVVGKFNRSAVHAVFDMEEIEDDFAWKTEDNQSFDPGLVVSPPKLQAVVYEEEGWRGAPDRSAKEDLPAAEAADELDVGPAEPEALHGEPSTTGVEELERMMAELEQLSAGGDAEASEEKGEETEMEEEPVYDEPAFDFAEFAEEGMIKNFAPYVEFSPGALPIPSAESAKAFGASPDRVRQY